MKLLKILVCLAAFVFLQNPSYAASSDWIESQSLSARLISSAESLEVGETIDIGIEISLQDGWHTYWRFPGIAGQPPSFIWKKDETSNVVAVQEFFPVPERLVSFDIEYIGYSYHNNIIFPAKVTVQDVSRDVDITVSAEMVSCKNVCLPEQFELNLRIPAKRFSAWDSGLDSSEKRLLDRAISELPAIASDGKSDNVSISSIEFGSDYIEVEFHVNDSVRNPEMFIENAKYINFLAPRIVRSGGVCEDENCVNAVALRAYSADPFPKDVNITELPFNITFVNNANSSREAVEFQNVKAGRYEGGFSSAVSEDSVQNNEELFISSPNRNLWLIILFAFIGGFILNLMPCVLPVLAIKLMSVINHAGAEKSRIRIGFMFNVLGIIFSFLVLAGLVIFLKHIKYAVGWGIHFQQPAFLVFLILVLVIFALNLFGVFEFSLPKFITNKVTVYKRGSPVSGEFFAGVLATLLATPCSAPFLGTAVAFSLAAGGLEVLVIFLFIGIGMSVPYLMIALFPHLVAFLPKSGKWMLSLKRILGLLLILTAVWLGFVLNTQLSGAEKSETSEAPEKLVWQKFDEEAMQQHLADGKIVFLDVTADWCLTCKANKLFTFNNKKVIQVLDVPEIVLMQADWTQSNEKISALLAKHGRYGIPFNVIYKQDREAVVLPELLTPSLVIKAIDKWKVEN